MGWHWVVEHMCWLKYVETVGNSMVVISPHISVMIDQIASQRAAETTFIIAWHTEGLWTIPDKSLLPSTIHACACILSEQEMIGLIKAADMWVDTGL